MSWATQATTTFDDLGTSATARLDVWNGSSQSLDLPITFQPGERPTWQRADPRTGPLKPTMTFRLDLQVLDKGRQLLPILDANTARDVRLEITRGGDVWFRGLLYKLQGGDKQARRNPALQLSFTDLRELKSLSWNLRGRYTVGELFTIMLDALRLDLPVRVYSSWMASDPDNTATSVTPLAEALRYDARDLGNEGGTYWSALVDLCRKGFHVVQQAGEW